MIHHHGLERSVSSRRSLVLAALALSVLSVGLRAPVSPCHATTPPHLVDPETAVQLDWQQRSSSPPSIEMRSSVSTPNQELFDVQRYELRLEPDFAELRLSGEVTIQLCSLSDGLRSIDLDLFPELEVTSALHDGLPVGFAHQGEILSVDLGGPLDYGDTATVAVRYGGTPTPAGFMGFEFREYNGRTILATLSEPTYARSWWPCKDVPTDKAEVSLQVLVPWGLYAASNGELRLRMDYPDGRTMFWWEERYPISTYNVSLAVADYVSWSEDYVSPGGNQMRLEYHVFPEHYEAALYDFGRTAEILDYYTSLFGEYPFIQEKYGMAEFAWEGAMEHQTMTSYGDFFLTGDRFYERIVGHELAHQWWGNLLTVSDWNEIWLHEAFATYSEALWIEHDAGTPAYRSFMRQRSASCCGFPGPIVPPERLFNTTVYQKGAWVLHMLRRVLGDPTFFQGLRDVAALQGARYGNITTLDVIQTLEDASAVDLDWFFDQWLYREGRPVFDLAWAVQPSDDQFRLDVTIEQVQESEPFTTPMDLRIESSSSDRIESLWISGRRHTLTFYVDEPPVRLELDPEGWILHWSESNLAPSDVPRPTSRPLTLLPNSPNPFNPRTILRFELPSPSPVVLQIFDSRGRLVETLPQGVMGPGLHEVPWTAARASGDPLNSGVYHVVLDAAGRRQSQKILLVK
jgi:aminopeptidase N